MLRRLPMRWLALFLLASLIAAPSMALRAQESTSWEARYYDNEFLVGDAKIRRGEGALSFDWGIHSPGEGIPADGFSARFGADPYLSGGTYRFEFRVDDAFNFHVDHQLVLTTYNSPRPGQLLYVDVSLAAGTHHFQVDYREITGHAYLHLRWYNITNPPAPVTYPADQLADGGIVVIPNSWYAQYYNNQTLSGRPLATQTADWVIHDWGSGRPQRGIPSDHWSARFSINHTLQGGRYTAILNVHYDDGVRFIVNGHTWLDTWGNPQGGTLTATRELSPGPHTLTIEYNDNTHYAFLRFHFKREGPGSGTTYSPAAAQPSRPVATPFIDVVTYGEGRVWTGRLNVRSFPDTRESPVLAVTTFGNSHPIVGRNVDGSWLQIVSNGRLGWVYARYLTLNAAARRADIPITYQSATSLRPETGYGLIARVRTYIRAYPGEGEALLGTLPAAENAVIVGRTEEWGWWQIRYDGMQGWVAADSVRIDTRLLLREVPVTAP